MRGASGSTRAAVALLCVAALAATLMAIVAGQAPAGATVQSVTPASATVTAGGAAGATVRVEAAAVVCLQVSQPHSTISASVDRECDAGDWSTGLQVRSRGDTPAGTYTVTVSDGESSRTFTLRVQAPPPPTTTTVRPTTTTVRPTTTARPVATTPTTAAPPPPTTLATTTVPTTAPASTTTSTTSPLGPGELRGEPFAPVDALVDAGIPDQGVFIPLAHEAFADCLPLEGPCADHSSPVVLVPARAYDITWPAGGGAALPSLLASRGLESLQVVGSEPETAPAATFSLAVLDLATGDTGEIRAFESHLDDQRRLVPGDAGGPTLSARLEPPITAIDRTSSRAPFGRPYRVSTRRLTEAAPVLVVYGSADPQMLYALRAPRDWGLGRQSLPLLGSGRVPYLARNIDGPPGLVVPIPAAIARDLGPEPAAATRGAEGDGSGGAQPSDGPLVAAAALVVAAGAFAVLRLWRRRRSARV